MMQLHPRIPPLVCIQLTTFLAARGGDARNEAQLHLCAKNTRTHVLSSVDNHTVPTFRRRCFLVEQFADNLPESL